MYKNAFIVLIKKNGKPLREINGKEVYIPFNSEYTLELRNNNYRKAVAKITIDSADVLGSHELIIPANGSVMLERFIADGDLNKGKKLKFVPLSDGRVADPSSPENGLIEIEFWLEKPPYSTIQWIPTYPQFNFQPYWCFTNTDNVTANIKGSQCNVSSNFCSFGNPLSIADNRRMVRSAELKGNAGATVEGSRSNQSFTFGTFGEKEYPSTIFRMWLRGLDLPITTSDSIHCVNCGKKLKSEFRFCPKCGNGVEIA